MTAAEKNLFLFALFAVVITVLPLIRTILSEEQKIYSVPALQTGKSAISSNRFSDSKYINFISRKSKFRKEDEIESKKFYEEKKSYEEALNDEKKSAYYIYKDIDSMTDQYGREDWIIHNSLMTDKWKKAFQKKCSELAEHGRKIKELTLSSASCRELAEDMINFGLNAPEAYINFDSNLIFSLLDAHNNIALNLKNSK